MRLIALLFLMSTTAALRAGDIDSLRNLLQRKNLPDTTRGQLCADMAYAFYTGDGALDSSMRYYQLSLQYFIKAGIPVKISLAHAGCGLIYREKGIYDKSLEHYLQAHKYGLEARDPLRIAKALVGVGVVHNIQHDFDKAIYYYGEAEKIFSGSKNMPGLASVYNNTGLAYEEMGRHNDALRYYNRALKINTDIADQRGIATNCENIGLVYLHHLHNPSTALSHFARSISLWRGMGDRLSVSITLQYIASALFDLKQYKACSDTASLSLRLALEAGSLSSEMSAHQWLYKACEARGDIACAYDHFKKYSAIQDSLNNEDEIRRIAEAQLHYDYEKKHVLDSVQREAVHQREVIKKQLEIDQGNTLRNWLVLGLLLTLALIAFILVVLYRNKKARIEIARQKMLIEQRNAEVMDSIKYASRIQQAILPPDEQVVRTLPGHFILYMPKDIVSGDFYWVEEKGDLVFIAVVDCTGHGVPGAFMSIVGRNGLNDAVNIAQLTSAAPILDFLNKYVNETLHQRYEQSTVRDGMDIALCVWNRRTGTVDFAGANNPVWVLRHQASEIEEITGDKQPIGNFVGQSLRPFTPKQFRLEKGDALYLFSDGYADQFGGPKKKKLKYKRLKQIIAGMATREIHKQGDHLRQYIHEWKGDLEQVDDICVVGIKI